MTKNKLITEVVYYPFGLEPSRAKPHPLNPPLLEKERGRDIKRGADAPLRRPKR